MVWRTHRLNPISIKTKQNRKSPLSWSPCFGEASCHIVSCPMERPRWQDTEGGRCLAAREEVKPFPSPALRWQYPRPTPCPLWDPEPENPAEACLDFCQWQTANILSFPSHTLPVSLLPLFNPTTWRKGVTEDATTSGGRCIYCHILVGQPLVSDLQLWGGLWHGAIFIIDNWYYVFINHVISLMS